MAEPAASPIVSDHRWGEITVEGLGRFRDVKLWPGGGREWDWDETGTRHEPGIQPADVEELLAAEPEVVVLSRGDIRGDRRIQQAGQERASSRRPHPLHLLGPTVLVE